MELSAIGEQVFAVESVIKKRVRKVSDMRVQLRVYWQFNLWPLHTYNMLEGRGHTRPRSVFVV